MFKKNLIAAAWGLGGGFSLRSNFFTPSIDAQFFRPDQDQSKIILFYSYFFAHLFLFEKKTNVFNEVKRLKACSSFS